MSEDDFLWPPEAFEDNADPALAQKLQHSMDIIFAQLRRLQTAAAIPTTHNILSATHLDTTVAAAAAGDLLRRGTASMWERLGIGIAGQALIDVLGLPAWSNDGHALLIDAANIDSGVLPTARYLHNLLSAPHQDSTPAAAVLGDMIVAQQATAGDLDAYWLDGLPFDDIANVANAGDEVYWLDGLPDDSLEISGALTWQRKANGTTGHVWTASATGPDWQPAGSSGSSLGAVVYRAGNFVLSDRTQTAVTLTTVTSDNGPFWASGAPTRLTVPAGYGGVYAIVGQASFASLTGRRIYVEIYVNGAIRAQFGGDLKVVQASTVLALAASDYVELYVYAEQNVAGDLDTVQGGATSTFLSLGRLSSETVLSTELPAAVAGALIKGNSAASAYDRILVGPTGRVLRSDGSAPAWAAATAVITSVATGAQNDWAPGLVGDTLLVWTGGADLTVTGFAAGYTGQRLVFVNAGSFVASFTHQSGASAAGNKLRNFVTTGNLPVAARGAAVFVYDGTDWRLVTLQPNGLAIAFNAGNFTASGTMTWTVEVGDQISYAWTVKESLMTVIWYIQTTSVTAPLSNELRIALPPGFVVGTQFVAPCFAIADAPTSAVHETCIAFGGAGNSYFGVFRLGSINWLASVNNCSTWGTVSFLL